MKIYATAWYPESAGKLSLHCGKNAQIVRLAPEVLQRLGMQSMMQVAPIKPTRGSEGIEVGVAIEFRSS
ncbi:MAG TPA: hypothetical protein VGH81_11595 [Rudaea sp.]|jgi:hypothetical protein